MKNHIPIIVIAILGFVVFSTIAWIAHIPVTRCNRALIQKEHRIQALTKDRNFWKAQTMKWMDLATSKQGWLKITRKDHKKIVDWVMRHSSRISRREASEIVSWCDDKKLCFALLALIQVESAFDPTRVSSTGAIGLGQIMPLWVPELKKQHLIDEKRDLFDPLTNITCTEYVLGKYLKDGSFKQALVRYRGKESKSYLQAVYSNLGELFAIMGGV